MEINNETIDWEEIIKMRDLINKKYLELVKDQYIPQDTLEYLKFTDFYKKRAADILNIDLKYLDCPIF